MPKGFPDQSTRRRAVRLMHAVLAAMAIALLVSGCYRASSYEGDGKLIDYGWKDANHHYVLDLGPIDLTRAGSVTFVMRHLPEVEFTAGLDVDEAAPHRTLFETRAHAGRIRLTLESADHRTIIAEEASLGLWIWSFGLGSSNSFVYRRGVETEVPLGQGVSRHDRIGVKADGGWGTYFTPRSSERYTLTLAVLEPVPSPQRSTRLTLESGGWK